MIAACEGLVGSAANNRVSLRDLSFCGLLKVRHSFKTEVLSVVHAYLMKELRECLKITPNYFELQTSGFM